MKLKRNKLVRKSLSFYVNNYNFRPPFQVIVDGTFCFAALNNKINIKDNIAKYLQDSVKFLTTHCVIIETEKLGKEVLNSLFVLKQFGLHKCGHEGNPLSASSCLLSMVGSKNPNHYIFAIQDYDLRKKLRGIPGVPLIYLHHKTPVLEHPSIASSDKANQMKLQTFKIPKEEFFRLKKIKRRESATNCKKTKKTVKKMKT